MIRAALGSLITRRVTPPPAENSPPLFHPKQPMFAVSRHSEPYVITGDTGVLYYTVEHGVSLSPFMEAWLPYSTSDPSRFTALARALDRYIQENGPIGEGRVVMYAGKAWTGSFRIEENKQGTVLVLRLIGYGPDEEVLDWSLDTVAIAQQLR